jgi:hypothetical protein
MEDTLDYHQIQGNIMLNYADYGFIKARYLFIRIDKVNHGMEFVKNIWKFITPASSLMKIGLQDKVPTATTNVAFTYHGLQRLGLPALTLQSFPDEFIMGMNARRKILGDDKKSSPEYWDKIWKDFESIHIFISMEARNPSDLENRYNEIIKLINEKDGIQLLDGHRSQVKDQTLPYQEASALYENGIPTPKEHFGYTDGISNPFFRGMTEEMGYLLGGGKKNGEGNLGYGDPELESTWAPLETVIPGGAPKVAAAAEPEKKAMGSTDAGYK